MSEPAEHAATPAWDDHFSHSILRRCRWALRHNQGRPSPAWSTGEQLAVALVLDDKVTLDELDYTAEQAAGRIRYDLPNPSQVDMQAWVSDLRAQIAETG
ncbi:hypothetical protein [Nonomuraea sp. NPDC050310]|uniref:hypothetical protein n=1 Tax=Nonomuraea sp. NPDC050310 TaxID=3154935 RepID=UPI0033E1C503